MKGPTEDFWGAAGVALIIFAMSIGIGSCTIMSGYGAYLSNQAKERKDG